jgi:hypothetical protein
MIEEAVDEDRAGTGVRRDKDGRLRFTYPVVILVGEVPGGGVTQREGAECANL